MWKYKNTCKGCKHFRKDKSFLLYLLWPFFNMVAWPWLWRDANEFGMCTKFTFGGYKQYASIAWYFDCKGAGKER